MKNLKKIILRTFIVSVILILILVIITSTTRFELVRSNSMEYFYAKHLSVDSVEISKKLAKDLVLEDINYLFKSIEEVHPNPFRNMSRNSYYAYRDSVKQTIHGDITREELFHKLTPLFKQINDNHTSLNFPEMSKGIDNKSQVDKIFEDSKQTIGYKNYGRGTGYLYVNYFAIDKHKFIVLVDSVFNQINKDTIRNLIIDIRNNPGGDTQLSDYLISNIYDQPYKGSSKIQVKRSEQYGRYLKGTFSWWFRPFVKSIKNLRDYYNTPVGGIYDDIKGVKSPANVPHRFSGKVYLLINANTFSTALGFATVFKDYNMGKIIGEETRAGVNEFGEIYPFDLPNSRLWVWCSTKRYIRPSGEMTVGGLTPDIYIKDKNDSILNYTINMIKNE